LDLSCSTPKIDAIILPGGSMPFTPQNPTPPNTQKGIQCSKVKTMNRVLLALEILESLQSLIISHPFDINYVMVIPFYDVEVEIHPNHSSKNY
jgi:hypothetical protein